MTFYIEHCHLGGRQRKEVTAWLSNSGYLFSHKVPVNSNDVIGKQKFSYKGVEWFVLGIKEGFIAYEVKSGKVLLEFSPTKNLNKFNTKVQDYLDTMGIEQTQARITRVVEGQMGVRIEPFELIIYGII